MIKVLPLSQMEDVAEYMDDKVYRYLGEAQIETMESFEAFDFIAFDWYDIASETVVTPKILIYFDAEDFFVFGESDKAVRYCQHILDTMGLDHPEEANNAQTMYRFFTKMLKNDMNHLEDLELKITETEEKILNRKNRGGYHSITVYRKELLRLKKYYEQLDFIFDELVLNDNELLNDEMVRRFAILGNRTERLINDVMNIREYVAQVREEYQAKIDSEQNSLMKVFTLITVIFLPLTLMVGWYGMNFEQMPELSKPYSYPIFAGCCLVVVISLIVFFKKKKWF